MVALVCDTCGYRCEHTALGMRFAMQWLASGKTKRAHCAAVSYTSCPGVLKSGLTTADVERLTQETLDAMKRS